MLILSWNVAGLSTTVQRIHQHYPHGSKSSEASAASSSFLASFFQQRHGADIVCLQEHKLSASVLQNRAEPHQIAVAAAGTRNNNNGNHPNHCCGSYESFWSCCRDPTSKGRNGVVTLVPPGCTVAADAAPLHHPALDSQGRCLRTNHCLLVASNQHSSSSSSSNTVIPICIFNVYVPCGPPTRSKMQFLHALRRAMIQQRHQGQRVLLVGDLNITAGKFDVSWNDRVVDIAAVLLEQESSCNHGNIDNDDPSRRPPQWKRDVQQYWNSTIVVALQTQQVVATQTTNSRTGATYQKYRLAVTVVDNNGNERRVFLGSHESTPEHCLYGYELDERSYVDEETGEVVVTRRANLVSVAVLTELMHKIAGISWSEATQREVSRSADVDQSNPARQWLNREILQEDGMVDAFRHFYPSAQGRFTCWNQNKNRRYVNDGCRLDYTLIDSSLLPFLQQGGVTAPRCPVTTTTTTTTEFPSSSDNVDRNTKLLDPLSEEAALAACTANGLFEPVSFEGGGMMEASRDALDTQFGPRHTGHIYTPPTFSDHIAVSVLLGSSSSNQTNLLLQGNLALRNDAATRKAQPHKQQRSIASFFTASSGNTSDVAKKPTTKSITTKKRLPTGKPEKVPPNSVLHHFSKKKMKNSG